MSLALKLGRPRTVAVIALAASALLDLSENVAKVLLSLSSTPQDALSPLSALAFAAIGVALIGSLALGLFTRFLRVFAVALALLTTASTWGVIMLPGRFTVLSGVDVVLGIIAVGALILTAVAPRQTPRSLPKVVRNIDTQSITTTDKVVASDCGRGSLDALSSKAMREPPVVESRRSKPIPAIVLVLIVVGLSALIHPRVSSPGQAVSQTIQDIAGLWSHTFAGAPHVEVGRPSGRPS